MKTRSILSAAVLATLLTATLAAVPQNEKQPIIASTGRFGDPTSVARKYQDYLFGIVKQVTADQVVLAKTKFGVDQAFKFNKKTKFTLDGKPSTFDKIKVGEGVFIDVETDKKTGDLFAKKVVSGVDMPTIPNQQ